METPQTFHYGSPALPRPVGFVVLRCNSHLTIRGTEDPLSRRTFGIDLAVVPLFCMGTLEPLGLRLGSLTTVALLQA